MPGRKQTFIWLLIGICLIGGILTAASYYSPRFINSPALKRKIQAAFRKNLNLHIDYRKIDISLFPRPHMVIHQGMLSHHQRVASKFLTASIFLKIFPLLKGHLEFAAIGVDSPDIKLFLSEKKDAPSEASTEAIINVWKELSPVMAYLAKSENDGISLRVKRARMEIYRADRPLLSIWDLDWRLDVPGDKLNYRLSCRSNFWEDLFHQGTIDRRKGVADGTVRVKKLRIAPLQRQYFPSAFFKLGDSLIDVNLSFETDGHRLFAAKIKTAFSPLTLMRGEAAITINGDHFDAGFSVDGSKIKASLTLLNLSSPKIRLAGDFFLDSAGSDARLDLRGSGADVASIRKVLLFMAGNDRQIQDTFDILRAGRANEVLITCRGKKIQDLGLLENMVIRGELIDGRIFVPGVGLDLNAVRGETVISKGVLEGFDLSAQLGNSRGKKGTLKIDLQNDNGPFLLDIAVDADLSQLPPVLIRLIHEPSFQKELKRLTRIRGRALGRLRLGDTISDIEPSIDVSEFNISADYQRVPFPLSLKGESFRLNGTRIQLAGLDVSSRIGTVSGITGSLDWGRASSIDVKAGASKIRMENLYPWLQTIDALKERLAACSAITGDVRLSAVELKGSLFTPEKWNFGLAGTLGSLVADVKPVGDRVFVERGSFAADRRVITFSETKMRILDASLNLSGRITNYIDMNPIRSIDIGGVLGDRAIAWASTLVSMPPEIVFRSPLWISAARLVTDKGGGLSCSGKLAVQKGPGVDIDISKSPTELAVKSLHLKDETSDAMIKLAIRDSTWDLSFKGLIEKSTIDGLLKENKVVTGWVAGDLQIRIHPDEPSRSTAEGTLRGEGFLVFLPITTLRVNRVTLEAAGNHLKIDDAQVLWIDEKMDIRGDLTILNKSIKIDLDVSAEKFDWNKYGNLITGRKAHTAGQYDLEKARLPLVGNIRFDIQNFRYGNYTWRPVLADLSMKPDYLMVDVHKADLCGISMPGMISIYPKRVDLTFGTVANDAFLDDTLHCLNKHAFVVEGRYDLDGYASMKATPGVDILPGLNGKWQFTVKDGHINRLTVLARIFELMNVADIFMLKLPDLKTKGFDYKQIDIHWRLNAGKVYIDVGHLDSSAMEIAFKGTLDLISSQVDVLVMVAPLQTMNLIVKNIPILRNILSGKFISIPFRVKGDLRDPSVIAMNPKDIGSEMLGVMKRTVKVPMQIIQPLTDGSKQKETERAQPDAAPAQ